MKNCMQGNLIIFAISGECGAKDKPANPYCQGDSEDYQKLIMSKMKSKQDNLITAIVSKNPAGKSCKAAQREGWSKIMIKNSGVFEKIPKGVNLLYLPHRKSAANPCCQLACTNWCKE
jgi:hypothetical protein